MILELTLKNKDNELLGKISGYSLESIQEQFHKIYKVMEIERQINEIKEETAEEQERDNFAEKNKEQLQMIHATTYKGTDDSMPNDYDEFINNSTLEELKKYVEVN